MQEEHQAIGICRREHRSLPGVVLILAGIVIGYGLGGCVETVRSGPHHRNTDRTFAGGTLSEMHGLVALNFLSGEPWEISLLPKEEAARLLSKTITLKEGEYSIRTISAEIARSTDKAVVWVPPLTREIGDAPLFMG